MSGTGRQDFTDKAGAALKVCSLLPILLAQVLITSFRLSSPTLRSPPPSMSVICSRARPTLPHRLFNPTSVVFKFFIFPFPLTNTHHPIEREISHPTRRRLPLRKPERECSLHDGQGQERCWTRRKHPQQRCLNPRFCSVSSTNIVVTLRQL